MITNPKAVLAIQHAAQENDHALKLDGFDNAVISTADVWHPDGTRPTLLVYSTQRIIDTLMQDGLTYEDAIDHFYFNIHGAYMGRNTPIIINDLPNYQ
ncbi:MAG: hypothetical protein VW683_03110 [Betaproteobacteria bacterium]